MTPLAMPVLVIMLQFYPGAGTAIPVPRTGSSGAVMLTFLTMDDCNRERNYRSNSQDFFCVEFKSDKIIDYTFPQDKSQHSSLEDVSVGPLALKDADKPFIEPRVTEVAKPPLDITPKQAAPPAPKKQPRAFASNW